MRPTTRSVLASLAVALVLPAGAVATGVRAASAAPPTIVVDTWDDELAIDGDCSLREAVTTLNAGVDVDACSVPVDPVVDLPAGLFVLDAPLVVGVTATLQGAGAITSSIDCGAVAADCLDNAGAATDLTVRRLQVSAGDSVLIHAGVGAGALRVEDSVLYGGSSGVVSEGGPVTVARSSVWDNDEVGVGAVDANVVITDSVIGGNDAAGAASDGGLVSVTGSTIWKNEGFGIHTASGNVLVAASTVADNGADAVATDDGTVTFSSATVVGSRHAVAVGGTGVARAVNTVFADHAVASCAGAIDSLGANVSDDDSCGLDDPTDRTGIDPGLEPADVLLARPGFPLAADSPLVDSGAGCHPTDELGTPRPLDGDGDGVAGCDVGALERAAVAGPPDPADDPTDPADPLPSAPAATPVPGRPTFTG